MTKKLPPEEKARRAKIANEKRRAWAKAHPRTAEQRAAQSKRTKEAWAAMSPEKKAELSEKHRKAAIKQMADPKARARISEAIKEVHKREGYRNRFKRTEEYKRKISEAQKGKSKQWMKDPVKLAAAKVKYAANADATRLHTPEVQAKAQSGSAKDCETNPLRGKFETNLHAKEWHLRSPDGVTYHFRNLRHFIRNHKHLFTEHELAITDGKAKTRVESSLYLLSPDCRKPARTAHGWSWVGPRDCN